MNRVRNKVVYWVIMAAEIKKKNATDTSEKTVKEKKERQKYTELDEVILKDSYWLNRVFFLRSLAFIYCKMYIIFSFVTVCKKWKRKLVCFR